jgi:hypothetical protein
MLQFDTLLTPDWFRALLVVYSGTTRLCSTGDLGFDDATQKQNFTVTIPVPAEATILHIQV